MLRYKAEKLASQFPSIVVEAEKIAATLIQGLHGRYRSGHGETFWQFRHYNQEDTPNKIDWRRSAKSEELFLRETETEVPQSLWIWCDHSPSMTYRSDSNLLIKKEAADTIALTIAMLLVKAGEKIAFLGSRLPAYSGQYGINMFISSIERRNDQTNMPPMETLLPHSEIILISDFLEPIHSYIPLIKHFQKSGCIGHCLQVLDPAEVSFPFKGRIQFHGFEDEKPYLISNASDLIQDYKNALIKHNYELKNFTQSVGWHFNQFTTSESLENAIISLYHSLSRSIV